MSHLTTIISRAKSRERFKNDPEDLFWQAIVNMEEYMTSWGDFTDEEEREANSWLFKYAGHHGELIPSKRYMERFQRVVIKPRKDPKTSQDDYCPLCGALVGKGNYDPKHGCGECAEPFD